MNFYKLKNIPEFLKTNDWRKRSFSITPKFIPNRRGIYILSIKLDDFVIKEKPNIFSNVGFYPVYIGETLNFRRRFKNHLKEKEELSKIKENVDFWYLILDKTKEELVDIQNLLIDMLAPVINIRRDKVKDNLELEEDSVYRQNSEDQIIKLIKLGENEKVEFKETLYLNTEAFKKKQVIKDTKLSDRCIFTTAAFLNTKGGTLLIGVSDTGEIKGIERDLMHFFHNSIDRIKGAYTDLIKNMLGNTYWNYITIKPIALSASERCILKIDVKKYGKKVFVNDNDFYIRTPHGNEKLLTSKIDEYWNNRKQSNR